VRLSTIVIAIALGAGAAGRGAAAQQKTVRRDTTLASGEKVSRECSQWRSMGILVLAADSRKPGLAGEAYFGLLQWQMERRFTYVLRDSVPIFATFAARALKDGQVTDVRMMRSSSHAGFDMEAQRAASIGAEYPFRDTMPSAMPDSLTIFISFGRQRDGKSWFLQHTACPAVPLPGNPEPKYPATAMLYRFKGSAQVHFTVDAYGAVDADSVTVLEATNDAFADAAAAYVARLHYLPAEFDDRREAQAITRTIDFTPPDQQNSDSR
jgi:TonB family protein